MMRYEQILGEPDFRIGNIHTVKVTRDKGYRHSYKNGRMNCGFVYITRGLLCESFSDENVGEIRVGAGEVLFIPNKSRYVGIYSDDNTEAKIMHFDLISGSLPQYLRTPSKIEIPGIGELIERFFDDSEAAKHPFYYLSVAYEVLWQIDKYYSGIPGKYKRLLPALKEMGENFADNVQVSCYAELCGMSEVNFRRIFRELMETSPIDYRNGLRLKNARTLLQSGEYNVTEAAELSGFSNLSFFIKLYKSKYGHTPKKE